ncbi:MAG TPA: tetratricopeptide repeat protein, partial [Anaeromyxobacter sp.]
MEPAGREPPAREARRAPRSPPPVPTAVPIAEPDPERLEALGRKGSREISAEAADELARARRLSGAARAHALEDFVARYPRHPSADNALVEAAAAYAETGSADAACELARRAKDDYPAGDAMSDALERLAWCESRRGATAAERRLLERLVADFPKTPAADRAGARLATISGHAGDTPAAVPARSGP